MDSTKELDSTMNSMREIKRETMAVMISMRMGITIIIEIEIAEGIKIGGINLTDLLRKSDFLPSINQCLLKRILKVIRISSLISMKFRMLIMIMLPSTKKNRIMNFIKDTEMILGLLKGMILLKFSNKNKLL